MLLYFACFSITIMSSLHLQHCLPCPRKSLCLVYLLLLFWGLFSYRNWPVSLEKPAHFVILLGLGARLHSLTPTFPSVQHRIVRF